MKLTALALSRFSQKTLSFLSICLVGGLLAVFLGACSAGQGSSTVRLQFPDWNEMRSADVARQSKVSTLSVTEAKLSMIVVNVTGPGITQPVLFNWESHDNAAAVPPTDIALTVSRGQDRLIQILAIYEGSGGGMQFYYADALKTFNSDTTDVTLSLVDVATSQGMIEGSITGRYMDTATTGPTGVFAYRFGPPGKPAMIIKRGEIFNGWMRLFAFSQSFLSYSILKDGVQTPLFQGLHNTSAELFPASYPQRSISALIPAGFKARNNGGPVTYEARAQKRIVAGFFGPGALAAGQVCYSSTNAETLRDFSADNAGVTPITWRGSSSPGSATEAYVELRNSVRGGNSAGSCSSVPGNEWITHLNFKHKDLGDEEALHIRGPFRPVSVDGSGHPIYVELTHASGVMTATWQYLPDVTSVITQVGVFSRVLPFGQSPNDDNDLRADDGYRCNNLEALGFTKIMKSTGVNTETFAVSDADKGRFQVIVCPFNNNAGNYFTSGVMGALQGAAGNFEEIRVSVAANALSTSCVPVTLSHYLNNTLTPVTSNLSITLSAQRMLAPVAGGLFKANCADASGIPSINLPTSQSSVSLYYDMNNGGLGLPGHHRLQVSATGMSGEAMLDAGLSVTPVSLILTMSNLNVVTGSCYPLSLTLVNGSSLPANNAARTYTLVDASGGTFHSDSACAVALPSDQVAIGAAEYGGKVFIKPGASVGPRNISTTVGSPTATPLAINVAAATVTEMAIEKFDFSAPQAAYQGLQCVRVHVQPKASNGARTKVPANTTATLSSPGSLFQFGDEVGCTTLTPTKVVTLNTSFGDSGSAYFYIQAPSSASISAVIDVALASPVVNNAITWTLLPDAFSVTNLPLSNNLLGTFCHALTIGFSRSGSPITSPVPQQFSARFTGANIYPVYQNPDCTVDITNQPVFIPANAPGTRVIYFRANSTNGGTSLELSSPLLTSVLTPFMNLGQADLTPYVNAGANASPGTCVPFEPRLKIGGAEVNATTPLDVRLTADISTSTNLEAAIGGYYFYSNNDCSAPIPETSPIRTIPAGQSRVTGIWIKMQPSLSNTAPLITAVHMMNGLVAGPGYNVGFSSCGFISCY